MFTGGWPGHVGRFLAVILGPFPGMLLSVVHPQLLLALERLATHFTASGETRVM